MSVPRHGPNGPEAGITQPGKGERVPLEFCSNALGDPALENFVSVLGLSYLTQVEGGEVLVRAPFIRGDTAPAWGNLDLQDAMTILFFSSSGPSVYG